MIFKAPFNPNHSVILGKVPERESHHFILSLNLPEVVVLTSVSSAMSLPKAISELNILSQHEKSSQLRWCRKTSQNMLL